MSVQRRDNGKWRARYRDPSGRERARHFDTKRAAQDFLAEQRQAMRTRTYVDPVAGKITFSEWFAVYSERQVWAAGTRISAQQAADCVTFGDIPLNRIQPTQVQHWIKTLQAPGGSRPRGLAVSTIHTRYNYVHGAFLAAQKDKLIHEDPCTGVTLPRKPRASVSSVSIPTPEGVGRAVREAPEWFAGFVALCAFAGLRLGEAAGVQLGDVDFLRRTLHVRRQVQGTNVANLAIVPPKFGSERTVHLPPDLVDLIARHVQTVGVHGPEQWLFADVWGNLLNRSSAGHQWRRTRAAVALEAFTLHDLRHFYASGLIAAGCDVVTVQRALGHSQASITLNTYSHLWLDAADRTRSAAQHLMQSAFAQNADSVRTEAT
ncbi:tyrosine-type recombinase/integrase [Nocardioides yefusunii]|uniref:Tyrosine-type recombinase/integrase n=1 Tax=Nocardioides yefusunii TaxID=2500546 RepID=A0ABW1QYX1_9ACTN|nr:site-specific integrase [Nocardioides yefusunii]